MISHLFLAPTSQVGRPDYIEWLGKKDPRAAEQFWRAFWAVLRWVGPPLGLIALVVGGILGLKALRSRGRRTRGQPSTRIAGGWDEVLDAARDAGRPVPVGSTRLEAGEALRSLGATVTDSVTRATTHLVVADSEQVSSLAKAQLEMVVGPSSETLASDPAAGVTVAVT